MTEDRYAVSPLAEVVTVEETEGYDQGEWHAVRRHFGITAFGVNAYVAREDGGDVISRHTEVDDSGTRHEELYVVLAGTADFKLGEDEVEAPAGTLVYIRDPELARSASGRTAGTTVLAIGGTPGKAFEVSPWEREYLG